MDNREWRQFVKELKKSWRLLWRDRIHDRVRAEGIASGDYDLLFVDQGTVVIASRDYKPPNFREILEQHAKGTQTSMVAVPNPTVGGWGKFVRDVISRQDRITRSGRAVPSEPEKKKQQLKKGGKGWLHYQQGLLRRRF